MLALGLTCSSAVAEWTFADYSDRGVAYADITTIHQTDSIVKMLSLFDYYTTREVVDGKKFLSTISTNEYDCKQVKRRTLTASSFTGHMGQGGAIYTGSDESEWIAVHSDTIIQALWKTACGKH